MNNTYCFKRETCKLFNTNLLKRKQSEEVYKNLYCNTSNNWKNCKRYLVSKEIGTCPDFVMPNSSYSVEEIVFKKKKKLLI